MKGLPLVLQYDAVKQQVVFDFAATLHNIGTADDIFTEPWAELTPPTSSGKPIVTFDSSKFEIKEKNDTILTPFSVAKSGFRDLHFRILSELDRQSIPEDQGDWVLDVTAQTGRKATPLHLHYVFCMTSADVVEMKLQGIQLRFNNEQQGVL